MTTQAEQITALAIRVGTECKTLRAEITAVDGDVKTLQTTVQGLPQINDTTASATSVYSSSKVNSQITAAKQAVKNDLLGGAGAAYDTLKELADLINNNASAIQAIETLAAGHVKFDGAQELTAEQKAQARANIGAMAGGDLATDASFSTLVTRVTTVEEVVNTNKTSINTLKTALGDLTTDYVAAFNTALAAA